MLKEGWFEALEPVDITRVVFTLVAFGATTLGSQKTWLTTTMVLNLISGLSTVCFPSVIVGLQMIGKVDSTHTFLVQLTGIFALTLAAIAWQIRKSKDDNVMAAYFIARSLAGFVLLGIVCSSQSAGYNTKPGFSTQHLFTSGLVSALCLVGDLRQVFHIQGRGGSSTYREQGSINQHLLVEVLLISVGTFMYLGHPDFILQNVLGPDVKPDIIHLHILRAGGAFLFGLMIFLLIAINFHETETKKAILFIFGVTTVVMMGMAVHAHFLFGAFDRHLSFTAVVANTIGIANCFGGYYYTK